MLGDSEHNKTPTFPAKEDEWGWKKFFEENDGLITYVCAWRKWHFAPEVQADLAQRIRVELVKSSENFKEGSSLERFIKSIAIHRCIDEVRRQVRRNWSVQASALSGEDEQGFDFISATADPDMDVVLEVLNREKALALRAVLGELGETCKTAIEMFYFEGFSYAEISERVGVTVNTVGSRLAKCLGRLRDSLKDNRSLWEYFRSR